jgi:hypothetical protein
MANVGWLASTINQPEMNDGMNIKLGGLVFGG